MKRGFNIVLITFLGLIALACSKSKSYTDYLNDEKKAVERWIDEYNIDVIKDLPDNLQFEEGQFVRLESGVYMHVIDSGNGEKAVVGVTNVAARFVAYNFDKDSITSAYNNLYYNFKYKDVSMYDPYPLEFRYGATAQGNTNSSAVYYFQSTGLNIPLDYLGDSCIVSLIVPFSAGSYGQIEGYYPVYFEEIRYTFVK